MDAPSATGATPSEPTSESAANAEAPLFSSDPEAREREIVVDTPLYTATFSSRGGGLISFKLHDYTLLNGDLVDLVGEGPSQPLIEVDPDGPGPRFPHDFSDTIFRVQERPANGLSIGELAFIARGDDGARVERAYWFDPETYTIKTTVAVDGLPRRDATVTLAWTCGLPMTERDERTDIQEFASMVRVGDNIDKKGLKKFQPGDQPEPYEGNVQWVATRSKYFMSATFIDAGGAQHARVAGDETTRHIGYSATSDVLGGAGVTDYRLYIGPLKQEYIASLGGGMDKKVGVATMPLGSVFGWFAKAIYGIMNAIYGVIPNYGVCILIIAMVTKAIFFPLTRKSSQSMRAMSELKPEMDALREKYKKDAQKMNTETMALYKKHGVNPLAGCLPLLVQLPVFWALYGVLRSAIELRQAPFMLWIDDLSAPDVLIDFGSLPAFLPDQLHVLPILMAGTTILMQQKTMTDPRQKSLMYMMPVVMLLFFYNLPSGLNLYWTAQNLLAWAEQQIVKRKAVPATAKAA